LARFRIGQFDCKKDAKDRFPPEVAKSSIALSAQSRPWRARLRWVTKGVTHGKSGIRDRTARRWLGLCDRWLHSPVYASREAAIDAAKGDTKPEPLPKTDKPELTDSSEEVDRPGFDLGGSTGETHAGKGLGLGTDAEKNRKDGISKVAPHQAVGHMPNSHQHPHKGPPIEI